MSCIYQRAFYNHMQYPCPNCNGEFVAEEADAVNGVICPHCNQQVSVPAVAAVSNVPPLIPRREAGQYCVSVLEKHLPDFPLIYHTK